MRSNILFICEPDTPLSNELIPDIPSYPAYVQYLEDTNIQHDPECRIISASTDVTPPSPLTSASLLCPPRRFIETQGIDRFRCDAGMQ